MALYGFDESHYQTTVIPPDFGIFKATQGTTIVDPTCDTKYQAAKKAGKLVGVYHFATFGDAIAEANHFVDSCKGYLGEALLALDVETNTNVAWALRFLDQVYARTKVRPLIYMSASTCTAVNWSSVSKNYALWCAGYPAEFSKLVPPRPLESGADMKYNTGAWPFATIWQYSDSGGTLDRDIFYGTAEAWHKLAQGDRNVSPPTTPQNPPPTPTAPADPAPAEPPVQPPSAPVPETPQPEAGPPPDPTTPPVIDVPVPVEADPQAPVAAPKPPALSFWERLINWLRSVHLWKS